MLGDVKGWAERQKAPVTIFLIASLIASSLAFWFMRSKGVDELSVGADWPNRPWSVLTYPWAYMPLSNGLELMFFTFLLLWLSWVGRDLETEMGSVRFAGMWVLLTALGGLFLWIGWKVMHLPGLHGAPYVPEAALTVAWGFRHPTQSVMLYGVLPVSGRWLVVLTAATMLVLFGYPVPLLGVMAILNEGVAALWALERIPFLPFEGGPSFRAPKKEIPAARGGRVYDERYYDEVRRREQDRSERERLRKLLGEPPDDDEAAKK